MVNTLTDEEHPYSLYLSYNGGFYVVIDVEPGGTENAKVFNFNVIGSGDTIADIFLDAVFTGLDEMVIGVYNSTVTIMEIVE